MEDAEWISRLYSEQYETLRKQLYAIIRSKNITTLYSEVDDCIEETFGILLERKAALRRHENIKGWLTLTARNRLRRHYDKYITRTAHEPYSLDTDEYESETARYGHSQSESLDAEFTAEQIEKVKEHLGLEEYQLLLRYYDKAIPNELLAKELNLTLGSLRSRVSRLVRKMYQAKIINIFTFIMLQIRLFLRKRNERGPANVVGRRARSNKNARPIELQKWLERHTLIELAVLLLMHEYKKPARRMDLGLIDVCSTILNGGEICPDPVGKMRTWESIQARMRQLEQQPKRIKLRTVLVTVLLILALMVTALASGLLPWKLKIAWEDDVMRISIVTATIEESAPNGIGRYDSLGLEFAEALHELNMSPPLPTWIPEGFELERIRIGADEDASWKYVLAFYRNNAGDTLSITVRHYGDDMDMIVETEKNADNGHERVIDGKTYYLYTNIDSVTIMWNDSPYRVSVYGDITDDDMDRILQSIEYGG